MKNLTLIPILLPTEDASRFYTSKVNVDKSLRLSSIKESSTDYTINYHLYLCSTLPIKEGDWFIQHNENESILRKAVSYDWFEKNVKQKSKTENYLHDFFSIHKYYPYPMATKNLQDEMEDKVNGLVGYRELIEFTTDPNLQSRIQNIEVKSNEIYKDNNVLIPKAIVGVPAIDKNSKAWVKSYKIEIPHMRLGHEINKGETVETKEVNFLEEFVNRYNQFVNRYNQKDNQKGVDVEKLAEKYAEENNYNLEEHDEGGFIGINESAFAKHLITFHNQALQSNAGGFSLEDVEKAKDLLEKASYRLGQAIDIFNGSSRLNTNKNEDKYMRMVDVKDEIENFIQSFTKEQSKTDIVIEYNQETKTLIFK